MALTLLFYISKISVSLYVTGKHHTTLRLFFLLYPYQATHNMKAFILKRSECGLIFPRHKLRGITSVLVVYLPAAKLGLFNRLPTAKLGLFNRLPATKLGLFNCLPAAKLGLFNRLPVAKLGLFNCLPVAKLGLFNRFCVVVCN